jgi:hypothetical protein
MNDPEFMVSLFAGLVAAVIVWSIITLAFL